MENSSVRLNLIESKLSLVTPKIYSCASCNDKNKNLHELNEEIDLLKLKNNSLLD